MPLSIEIVSIHDVLVQAGIRLFQGVPGVERVVEVLGMPNDVALHHAPGCVEEVRQVFRKVIPLLGLELKEDPTLAPCTARLLLGTGEEAPFEGINLDLKVNDATLADELERALGSLLGTPIDRSAVTPVRRTRMLYGGAGRFCRRAFQLLLLSHGVEVWPHREWPVGDKDVSLSVCAPEIAARPPIEHNPVLVYTDDSERAEEALRSLHDRGFRLQMMPMTALPLQSELEAMISDRDVRPDRFCAALESLEREYDEQGRLLLELTNTALKAAGVDPEQMPLELICRGGLAPSLVMPLGAFQAGQLRPYGSQHAGRFRVQLVGVTCEGLTLLAQQLEGMGFDAVETSSFATRPVRRRGDVPPPLPPRISWPSPAPSEEIKNRLREAVRTMLRRVSEEPWGLEERDEKFADTVQIELPLVSLATLGLAGLKQQLAGSLDVRILSKDRARADELRNELLARGYRKITVDPRPDRERHGVMYGRAPVAMMEELRSWMEARYGEGISMRQIWGSHDSDVHLWIPDVAARTEGDRKAQDAARAAVQFVDLEAWVHGAAQPVDGPFLERGERWLRVGEQRLERAMQDAHPRTPPLADMAHYVLDATTAATVGLLASAVRLREPCLLEGETSTSKTSAILFLASQLGQPVLRLNLNGQTDTSELVGRYVPGEGASSWRWQDGLVVEAMTQGHWLILDELNLAEPQVLERLNPVLEREPSLTLTEGDGRVLRGRDVHPGFRVFATMNPASYAGRTPLSPALRDRFRAYLRVSPPNEHDVLVFLRALVLGVGSPISVGGRSYQAAEVSCCYPGLGGELLVREALPGLARFHASVASAFREPAGGRERVAFTRRALLSLLDFLASGPVSTPRLREALVRYYLGRVSAEDTPTMLRLLDASGLGPGTWRLGLSGGPGSPLDGLLEGLEELL